MSRNSDEKKRFLDDNEIEMGDKQGSSYSPPQPTTPRYSPAAPPATNNPLFPILAYCGSSILMTVTNKYVLGGTGFNLNFFLLAVQVGQHPPEGPEQIADLKIVHRLCRCDSVLQISWVDHISRLQDRRGKEMSAYPHINA